MLMELHEKKQCTPPAKRAKRCFKATKADYPELCGFISDFVSGYTSDRKTLNDIEISVDEIFSNIQYYSSADESKPTDICLELSCSDGVLSLVFADNGVPFNPLEKAKPSLAENRKNKVIGGFGIFMVRNLMDEVSYQYDNKNILSIKKKLQEKSV